MKVDWSALGIVAVVSVTMSVVFVALLAGGIRSVSAAQLRRNQGGSGTTVASAGYAMLGLAAVLVLFGIYLIVPQFH